MMRRPVEALAFPARLSVVYPDVEAEELAREAAAEQREPVAAGAWPDYLRRRFGAREPVPCAYPADA